VICVYFCLNSIGHQDFTCQKLTHKRILTQNWWLHYFPTHIKVKAECRNSLQPWLKARQPILPSTLLIYATQVSREPTYLYASCYKINGSTGPLLLGFLLSVYTQHYYWLHLANTFTRYYQAVWGWKPVLWHSIKIVEIVLINV